MSITRMEGESFSPSMSFDGRRVEGVVHRGIRLRRSPKLTHALLHISHITATKYL